MLKSLKIENFRCFRSFEMSRLGRVNLLVGANNSGKTSVLEAIGLLRAGGDLSLLEKWMTQRGEYWWSDSGSKRQKEYDISHLFYGRNFSVNSYFSIEGENKSRSYKLMASVDRPPQQLSLLPFLNNNSGDVSEIGGYNIIWKWDGQQSDWIPDDLSLGFPLSHHGGLQANHIQRFSRLERAVDINTRSVTPLSLDIGELTALFDELVLTKEESTAIAALQIIEPNIERIASVGAEKYGSRSSQVGERGGFKVLMSDSKKPVPIGSMGDGIWRMLALSLSLVCAKDGVLLVDEIDSGLHYSTMYDMWKMIYQTAERLNVDVFATTHNSDCWTSLAEVISDLEIDDNSVTIHRIERDKPGSIAYTEAEIVAAADMDLEVR